MTPAPTALVAHAYAAIQHLGHVTIAAADNLDHPAIYDRATNTIWVRRGLELDTFAQIAAEGIDALCDGQTVVEDDDGTAWAPRPRAVGDVETTIPPPRTPLHLV